MFFTRRWLVRRSAARQEKRINALRACKRMIESPGCSTPFPFEVSTVQ